MEVVNGDFEAAYSSKYDIEGWTNEYEVSDSYGSYVTARNGNTMPEDRLFPITAEKRIRAMYTRRSQD